MPVAISSRGAIIAFSQSELVAKATALSLPSAYGLIRELQGLGILKEITGGRRDKVYRFDDYLNIFRT